MSATNTTTNYGLPIFVETDKPAWLVDFNGAMRTIDTALKTNADAIVGKENVLTFVDSNTIDFTRTSNNVTADLSANASNVISRAMVKPVSSPSEVIVPTIDTANAQQNVTLGNGLKIDSDALQSYDLDFPQVQATLSPGANCSRAAGTLYSAVNAEKNLGKIYGLVTYTATNTTDRCYINTNIRLNARTSAYAISAQAMAFRYTNNGIYGMQMGSVTIQTDGSVVLSVPASTVKDGYIWLPPTILIFEDFK